MLNKYALFLNIYNFSKEKIKVDYSFIPLKEKDKKTWESAIVSNGSQETFNLKDYKIIKDKYFRLLKKEKNNYVVSILVETNETFEEAEKRMQVVGFNYFRRKVFFKRKMIKVLEKRLVSMGAEIGKK